MPFLATVFKILECDVLFLIQILENSARINTQKTNFHQQTRISSKQTDLGLEKLPEGFRPSVLVWQT